MFVREGLLCALEVWIGQIGLWLLARRKGCQLLRPSLRRDRLEPIELVELSLDRMLAIEKEDGIDAKNKHIYLNGDTSLPTSLSHAKIERYPNRKEKDGEKE